MVLEYMTVENVNETFADKIFWWQRQNDANKLNQSSVRLNHLLYSVIKYFVPQVNAVRIQTIVDVSRKLDDLPDNRGYLKDYIEKIAKGLGLKGKIPFLITAHLPCEVPDLEEIVFQSVNENRRYATLSVNLGSSSCPLEQREFHFLRDEIVSVQIAKVEDHEFSPIYQGPDKPLMLSPSALEHYLSYRGFKKADVDTGSIPDGCWKPLILPVVGNVLIPQPPTELLKGNVHRVEGFAATMGRNGHTLYKIGYMHLPEDLTRRRFRGDLAAYAAYAIAIHQARPQPNIKVYKGDEAIIILPREVNA